MPSCFDSRFSAIKLTLKSIFASFKPSSDSFFVFLFFTGRCLLWSVYNLSMNRPGKPIFCVGDKKKINQSKHHYSLMAWIHMFAIFAGSPMFGHGPASYTLRVGWCSLLVDEIKCSPFIHVLLALQAQSDEICWEKYARFKFSFKYLYLLAKLDHKLEGKKTRGVKRLSEWQNVHLWVSQIFIFISYK